MNNKLSNNNCGVHSYVLRPKDPYLNRPLPHVIGTEEWHKKWHVGLLESSSESETEQLSEKFSESDSESDLPVTNKSQACKFFLYRTCIFLVHFDFEIYLA